jgi:calcium-dependent protein kinase
MADADGSGEINYSEWLITVVSREKLMTLEKIESIFRLFDKDKSSTISVEEMKNMLGVAR